MFWLLGMRLQSYIRHLKWTLCWSVPDMESASPKRQSVQTAGKLPEELSATVGVG